jgi:hypothetical protein
MADPREITNAAFHSEAPLPSRRSLRALDAFAFFVADVQTGWGARRTHAAGLRAALREGAIVVYRVGDGSGPLTSAATPVFLDVFDGTGTSLATIPMPAQS